MNGRMHFFAIPFASILLVVPASPLLAGSHEGHSQQGHQSHGGHHDPGKAEGDTPAGHGAGHAAELAAMPGPGKKVQLGNGGYLVYGFDKKPKMGIAILKVEAFTSDGKKDTSLEILGDSGMPSMRGAHETGDQPFKLSKKGDYLLPVDIVMPGDWEVRLTIKKDGEVTFRGSYRFDV